MGFFCVGGGGCLHFMIVYLIVSACLFCVVWFGCDLFCCQKYFVPTMYTVSSLHVVQLCVLDVGNNNINSVLFSATTSEPFKSINVLILSIMQYSEPTVVTCTFH